MYDRNLIEYLPEVLRDVKENEAIMTFAEQPEMVDLWGAVDNTLNDQFIVDATENGVSRWENIFGIVPKATQTLDERKFTILSKNNSKLPFTLTTLKEQLTNLCGEGESEVTLDANSYTLNVVIALTSKYNYKDVEKLLKNVVPANLIVNLSLKYNRYEGVSTFTHKELQSYTHEQLRSDLKFRDEVV